MNNDLKIKEKIISEFDSKEIPDLSDRILEKYVSSNKTHYRKFNFKFFGAVITMATIVLICIPLFLSFFKTENRQPINDFLGNTNKNNQIAFGVFSSFNAISNNDNNLAILRKKSKMSINKELLDKHVKELNPYMNTIESLFNENFDFNPVVHKLTDGNYQYLMEIDSSGILLEFYYNQVKEYDEDEEEFNIDGIIKSGDLSYQVTGKKELEKDEYEIEFKISYDENNYVIMEKEYENENHEKEISYSYKYYENNQKSREIEISFEEEKNKFKGVEVEMNLLDSECYFLIHQGDSQASYLAWYSSDEEDDNLLSLSIDIYNEENKSYYCYENSNIDFYLYLERN